MEIDNYFDSVHNFMYFDLCKSRELNPEVFNNIEKEQERMMNTQFDLVPPRLATKKAYKKLIKNIFSGISDNAECHEFGCGPKGVLYNHLLEDRLKSNWFQYDINPFSVCANILYSAKIRSNPYSIQQASYHYMPFSDKSVDFVVGLSSWDSTLFLKESVAEVYRTLKKGGLFIHIQDVLPAREAVVVAECLAREKNGLEPKCSAEVFWKSEDWFSVIAVESLFYNYQYCPSLQVFNRHLTEIAKEIGFEIKFSGESEESTKNRRNNDHSRYPICNTFLHRNGMFSSRYLLNEKENSVSEMANAYILVAKK